LKDYIFKDNSIKFFRTVIDSIQTGARKGIWPRLVLRETSTLFILFATNIIITAKKAGNSNGNDLYDNSTIGASTNCWVIEWNLQ